MIYTVIAEAGLPKEKTENKGCHTRQPSVLLGKVCDSDKRLGCCTTPPLTDAGETLADAGEICRWKFTESEVKLEMPSCLLDYIDSTKNGQTKHCRKTAYTALFYSLYWLFGITSVNIQRNKYGKPYLTDDVCGKRVYFSISHSKEVVAVTISDLGDVGVDVEAFVDKAKGERLEGRFLSQIQPRQEDLKIRYLYFNEGENPSLSEIFPQNINITNYNDKINADKDETVSPWFTAKWTYCESVLKCEGVGFCGLVDFQSIEEGINCDNRILKIGEDYFSLSCAIKKR